MYILDYRDGLEIDRRTGATAQDDAQEGVV